MQAVSARTFCLRLRCSSPASLSWAPEELLRSLSETEAACSCHQHQPSQLQAGRSSQVSSADVCKERNSGGEGGTLTEKHPLRAGVEEAYSSRSLTTLPSLWLLLSETSEWAAITPCSALHPTFGVSKGSSPLADRPPTLGLSPLELSILRCRRAPRAQL
jgi:hypothetical protein